MAEPGLLLDNRYRLDDRIAAGGMGEVWRAADLVLHRPVAVKLMRPGYAQDGEGLARFRAEARYAGSLAHPNIAVVYDFWEGDPPGQPYLVMELVNGPSLAKVLTQGPMGPVPTLDVIAQTAAGLQVAHEAGLVHRDIKPANLLVSPGGQIKISDFGIARAESSATLTGTGLVVGTAAYMAPERVSGQPATPASDLYALGVVAHECLTGQRPFDGDALAVALAHLQQELPPLPPSVPPEVARLVAALTAKDPRARPPTAGAVAERATHLLAALTGRVVTAAAGRVDAPVLAAGASLATAAGPVSGPLGTADSFAGGETGGLRTGYSAGPAGGASGRLPAGMDGGYDGSGSAGPDERGRRRLPVLVAAGAAAVAAAGLAAWLVLPSGSPQGQPPSRPAQAARHSAPPAGPATPTPGLVNDGGQQPGSGAAASQAPSASPTPTVTAPQPSPAPTVPASSSPPAPTPSDSPAATTPPPTGMASPGPGPGV